MVILLNILIYLVFFNVAFNKLLYIKSKIVLNNKIFYFFLIIIFCGWGIIFFIENSKIKIFKNIKCIFVLEYIIISFLVSIFINKKI